jgi:hypothetical protein
MFQQITLQSFVFLSIRCTIAPSWRHANCTKRLTVTALNIGSYSAFLCTLCTISSAPLAHVV